MEVVNFSAYAEMFENLKWLQKIVFKVSMVLTVSVIQNRYMVLLLYSECFINKANMELIKH